MSDLRPYEAMFILSNAVPGGWEAVRDEVHATVEKHGGQIREGRKWGDLKLAYGIRRQKKGVYYLVYFSSPVPALPKIERDSGLSEGILRVLIIREPKQGKKVYLAPQEEGSFVAQEPEAVPAVGV
jgi:small subunit ribosomal protein S6